MCSSQRAEIMSRLRRFFFHMFARAAELPYRAEEWFFTRPLQPLCIGAPALIVSIGLLGIVAYQSIGSQEALVSRYQQAFDTAFLQDDWEAAGLFALKLAELRDTSAQGRFALARLAESRGQMQLARRLMAELAPDDSAGHPPAHYWIVQQLLREKQQWEVDESNLLVHHLEQSLKVSSGEQREVAGTLLAEIYTAEGRYEEAVAVLKSLVGRRPALQLKLAEIYLALEDDSQFRRELAGAKRYLREQVEADPADLDARLQLARAEALDGELAQAEAVLLAGLAQQDEPRLHAQLAEVYVVMSDQLQKSEPDVLSARLDLLQKALRHQPDQEQALRRLAYFLGRSGPQADKARAMLKDALANGQAPGTAHMILGTTAAAAGNLDEARLHLEQAHALNPDLPDLLNNLAWVLARLDPPQLQRALGMIDRALERSPEHPELRETRGQILARMGRSQDALVDLEFALRALRGRPRLHTTLAEIYQQLGDQDMARLHRERAQLGAEGQGAEGGAGAGSDRAEEAAGGRPGDGSGQGSGDSLGEGPRDGSGQGSGDSLGDSPGQSQVDAG
jgi:tetratricopeptide (TPR) repeat protein